MNLYPRVLKSLIDIIVSFFLLILLSPVIIFLVILLFIFNSKQIFFIQKRPGKNEKIFGLIKFKTMNDRRDEFGNLFPDSERLTKVGKFIRKFSLDELLQFINVLKGDMSLIGPRPLLIEYLPLYNDRQKKRHNVKPGITGWAQVNGRNAISWQKKFELDVWYVENISFVVDIKIFWLTIKKIILRDGINQKGEATVNYFKGNNT